MPRTQLKKILIRKFRALNNVEIEFGNRVTVICGKNGTSKSSILGIAAQIFSFDKDYQKDIPLAYETITGLPYKSKFSDHFRFSSTYDLPGSLDVWVELEDGYTNGPATAELELSSRLVRGKTQARPVVRKNSTAEKGKESRNFTHPVIFLSLKRLQPIASREYNVQNFSYLDDHIKEFIDLNNRLLNKQSSTATGTDGFLQSAVAHGNNYDQDSVSAGEDNAGQIILALMSFRKLQEEYEDYKGGLLLIDEADAGLFPAAQIKLLEILDKQCKELNIQVVMTSHSPTLIQHTYDLSKRFPKNYKTIYLTDSYGAVEAYKDYSWTDIYADLHTETVSVAKDVSVPRVNVYFEDDEGQNFFKFLTYRHPAKKLIKEMSNISLGCSNYIQLAKVGIPEFSKHSIIILDADVNVDLKKLTTIQLLPGVLPPDQLIFEYLYNIPAEDDFWRNDIRFTRAVFTSIASDIISILNLSNGPIDLKASIETYRQNDDAKKEKLRKLFKDFYKTPKLKALLSLTGEHNPWRRWIHENKTLVDEFREGFAQRIRKVLVNGYGVDESKINFL